MATKTPNRTKQLLEKISMSLKKTIAEQASMSEIKETKKLSRDQREKIAAKDASFFTNYMKIL